MIQIDDYCPEFKLLNQESETIDMSEQLGNSIIVLFFYPKDEIELFNNSIFNQRTQEMHENLDDDSYYSEFALCSPNDYLTYLYSQKCMSLRKLSQPYRFDGKNYN